MDTAVDIAAVDDPQPLMQQKEEDQQQQRNNENDIDGGMKSLPAQLYTQNQRVYAKDETTGLLYPAMIRKAMWGPKSGSSLPVPALLEMANNNEYNDAVCTDNDTSNDQTNEEEEDEDEDEHRTNPKLNCHHYYVHYMGWNVKWDRWVEECYLYDHSESTKLLADKIQKQYDKVKPKKKGQKMSVSQISRWMKKMVEVELEHRKLERENVSSSADTSSNSDTGKEVEEARKTDSEEATATANEANGKDESNTAKPAEEEKPKVVAKPMVKEETLQKQAQLRARGLQLKRKRIHADRLHIPFTLKKILVEEWEVISQCGMLYDLPLKVSVRDVLNSYLESKLVPMREKKETDNCNTSSSSSGIREDDKMEVDIDIDAEQSSIVDREKEWVNMVEGIALLFDQALPIHLLFEQERAQYGSLRRQILAQRRIAAYNDQLDAMKMDGVNGSERNVCASNEDEQPSAESIDIKTVANTSSEESKPLPDRMSEIYGCEHLLRLFIRLPSVVAATPSISEPDARRIFSKLGDLVRYIQKHQSELFKSTFRKPLQNEVRKIVKEKVEVVKEKVVAAADA